MSSAPPTPASMPALLPSRLPTKQAPGLVSAGTVASPNAAPGTTSAAFAADLAQLLALALPAAEGAALQVSTQSDGLAIETDSETESDSEPDTAGSDALAALWVELGIVAPPSMPHPGPPEHAQRPSWLGANGAETALLAVSGGLATARAAERDTALPLAASAQAELMAKVELKPAANDPLVASVPFVMPEPPRSSHSALPAAPVVVDLRQPTQAAQQVAENVVWQVGEATSEVQIRLNPEELGPLEVRLKLDGDKVAVRFDMADAGVRDVVQTSLPQLATMLSARGLQLDQAQVFQQDRGQAQPQFQPPSQGQNQAESNDDEGRIAAPRISVRRGLVDDYV